MKLVKKIDKADASKMASFRLSAKARHDLEELGGVLEKSKTKILEELIEQACEVVEKKFPGRLRKFAGNKRNA